MKIAKSFLSLALALTIASSALAGDGEKKAEGKEKQAAGQKDEKGDKAKRGEEAAKRREAAAKKRAEAGQKRRQPPALSALMLRGLELTDEQKEAIAPIDKEFGPKFAELNKSRQGLMTEEQKKAVNEIRAKARESKEKPTAELRKALQEAMKLNPEQQKQAKEIQAAQAKLRTDYLAKVDVILTDAQKEKLKSRRGAGRGAQRKPGERKPGEGKKPAGERRKPEGAKKPEKKDA